MTYIAPISAREALFADYNAKYPLFFDMCAPITGQSAGGLRRSGAYTLPYTTQNNRHLSSNHSNRRAWRRMSRRQFAESRGRANSSGVPCLLR